MNHKYKLIAFGRKNAEGIVYNVDEMTGGLVISHRLRLPTRDYPGIYSSLFFKYFPKRYGLGLSNELLFIIVGQGAAKL